MATSVKTFHKLRETSSLLIILLSGHIIIWNFIASLARPHTKYPGKVLSSSMWPGKTSYAWEAASCRQMSQKELS